MSLSVLPHLPADYRLSYSPLFYAQQRYLEANNDLPARHFYLVDHQTKKARGHIAFSLEEGRLLSPYKAPFSGFELDDDISSEDFLFFVIELERQLKEEGSWQIDLHQLPDCYGRHNQMVSDNLQILGYRTGTESVRHALVVDEVPLVEKMAAMEQRKLKKAQKAGLRFELLPIGDTAKAFDFVKRHREAKGHQLSLQWAELKGMVEKNKGYYFGAAVFDREKMAAAVLLVRATAHVVFYFYPAHDPAYDSFSPMVLLLQALYERCHKEKVAYIDLGTSYLNDEVNTSLAKFKEHMGGQPFVSKTFQKDLSL